ncbi:MAG TPA: NADP-dependent oxidoreductase [Acidimicrobiia bacterium]|jgi:NADPH:quinone reductase-like Zn-dependent oxidoreductase|nr:NADP-dependent oxidoreductase [Acidimicrobiia bacterium]
MRAIGVNTYGGPEALEIVELPEEQAGPGEVRLRVFAAAVNPTDTLARNGSRAETQKMDPPPYVPGMDAAGVVDQVGSEVTTGIHVGDAAMAMVIPRGAHGAYRESLVLKASSVVPSPEGFSHVQACSLPMNGLTATLSLELLGLQQGQVLAVTGGAGAYGGYMIELGKEAGLTVISDASDVDMALVKELGADIVVPRGDDFAEKVREHFPDGVDGLGDGAVLNELAIDAVSDGGAFTSVRGFSGSDIRNINFTTTFVSKLDGDFVKLDTLREHAENGVVTLRIAGTYPAENASDAHATLEAGGTRGRCVITF